MSYEFFIINIKKYYKIIIIVLIAFFILMTSLKGKVYEEEVDEIILPTYQKKEEVIEDECIIERYFVDIKGAVYFPGVYQVNEHERVIDVIQLAGGLTKEADTMSVNLSLKIRDQMVIVIPKESDEKIEYNFDFEEEVIEDNLISIKNASVQELMTLPGIGESKANEIIRYREENGFEKIEDLLEVSGIGQATFDKIKDLVKL